MAIKTIYFDFGGVLVNPPSMQSINRWKKILGLAGKPEIEAMLVNPNESPLVQDICLGKVSEDQLWQIMAEKWHVKPALLRRVRRWLFSKRALNTPMVRFMAELSEGYQTAILSNAGDQTWRVIEDVYHLDRHVEDIIISAEEGLIKPDPRIFQVAMDRLGATPETSLFIDDYPLNIEAARAFGMHAVQFINNEQTVQSVRAHLQAGG